MMTRWFLLSWVYFARAVLMNKHVWGSPGNDVVKSLNTKRELFIQRIASSRIFSPQVPADIIRPVRPPHFQSFLVWIIIDMHTLESNKVCLTKRILLLSQSINIIVLTILKTEMWSVDTFWGLRMKRHLSWWPEINGFLFTLTSIVGFPLLCNFHHW